MNNIFSAGGYLSARPNVPFGTGGQIKQMGADYYWEWGSSRP